MLALHAQAASLLDHERAQHLLATHASAAAIGSKAAGE
jgi:hypothetical protein